MKQLNYTAPGELDWVEAPRPAIETSGDAIVRPLLVSRCELDRFIASGALGWPGGFAFGHETYGEVVEVGDGVRSFQPGDRVVVPFQISCGTCGRCRQGYTALCESVPYRSSFGMAPLAGVDYGGGLADFLRVPYADHMLVGVAPDLDPRNAAGLADTLTTAHALVAHALQQRPGGSVLVVGGNVVAINVVRFASALGADRIMLIDDDPDSLALARRFGAEVVEATLEPEMARIGTFPITIDASGTELGQSFAIYSTAHEGICQSTYGGLKATSRLPVQHMYSTNITLRIGRVHARAQLPAALQTLHTHCDHAEPIVTHEVPFSRAGEVMMEPAIGMTFTPDAPV